MPGALQLGTLSYNGFTFPKAADIDVGYNYTLQASGMDKLYDVWTFRVSCIVSSTDLNLSNGASIDSEFTEVRHALNEHGKTFTFSGHGIGNFPQNGNSGFVVGPDKDLDFGPKVKIIRFKNIGQGRACEIEWECVCTVACCENSSPGDGGGLKDIGELSYSLSYSWDNNLLCTRSINGVIIARVHRKQGTPDTLDDVSRAEKFYENEFYKKVKWLEGFRRSHNRQLSPDRRTLNFSITDTEIQSDNPLDSNILTGTLEHTVSSTGGTILAGRWISSLSGTYTVGPKVPRSVAWQAFRKVWQQRQASAGSQVVLVQSFSARESIYGRDISFSISWVFTSTLSALFSTSGLWKPVDGSWKEWASSMEKLAGAFGPYKLSHKDGKDVIITFCDETKVEQEPTIISPGDVQAGTVTAGSELGGGYISYQNSVRFYRASNSVMIQRTGDGDGKNPLTVTDGISARVSPGSGSSDKNEVQDRGRSALYCEIKGSAVRVGSKPDIPTLKTVDGNNVATVSEDVKTIDGKSDAVGNPIFTSTWRKVYYVAFGRSGAVIEGLPSGLGGGSGGGTGGTNPGNLTPSQQPQVRPGVVVEQ